MLLNYLSRKILSKNKKLYNIYKDETCYLFGNGYSIKFINLNHFKNLNVLCSGFNYLHKDFANLKIVADFHIHPGIFSPIWKHPYTKKLTIKNKTRKFLFKTTRIPEKHIYVYSFGIRPVIIPRGKKCYFKDNASISLKV